MVVLMADPRELSGRQRLLDALRLLETLGAMDELQLRLVIVGEAANWLRPDLAGPNDLPSTRIRGKDPRENEMEQSLSTDGVEARVTDDKILSGHHSTAEIGQAQEEFLESMHILKGIDIKVGLCQVAARTYGVEGVAIKLGLSLVPFTSEVAIACKKGWQLISF